MMLVVGGVVCIDELELWLLDFVLVFISGKVIDLVFYWVILEFVLVMMVLIDC